MAGHLKLLVRAASRSMIICRMDASEFLAWVAKHEQWVYALLFVYCLAKTGPLPMIAGFVSAFGALRIELLVLTTLFGSIAGGQIRFALGRFGLPFLCQLIPSLSPWVALCSAGVERYHNRVIIGYRFVKGAFSLVGLGAGASFLSWTRFSFVDSLGAGIWVGTMVGAGRGFAWAGASVDPTWAAYLGLGLLVASMITLAIFSKRLKARLYPLAQVINRRRLSRKRQRRQ
jgi:membrane-associated protein